MDENAYVKYISISMANGSKLPMQDITDAISYAGDRLNERYGITLIVSGTGVNNITVKMRSKDPISGNPGNRLRGISDYMMKDNPKKYKNMRVGRRLLNFRDVSDMLNNESLFQITDVIRGILNLLDHQTEPINYQKLKRIVKIINE